jgi:5-methylcytosine-specific restriction endonuclease McrA
MVSRTLPGGRVAPHTLPRGVNQRPLCRWCELEILAPRRRTFCSDYCVHQWRLRTDPGYLRDQVFARDRGICALCQADTLAIFAALKRSRGRARQAGLSFYGMKTISSRRSLWDADHILAVAEGGGQCDLDNLRTLCVPCHREVTASLRMRLAAQKLGNNLYAMKEPAAPPPPEIQNGTTGARPLAL